MVHLNRVMLIGSVTDRPWLRRTNAGIAVANLELTISERRKGSAGEWIEDTFCIEVTTFSRTAEVARETLTIGDRVLVEGRLRLDEWEKDGKKHSKIKISADRMQRLERGNDGHSAGDANHQSCQTT